MNEQRNMLLAFALSALVLIGWLFLSQRYLPVANPPSTTVVKGKSVALPNATGTPVATGPAAVRDRNVVLAQTPRVKIAAPRLAGTINLKGAQIDDLVLTTQRETIAKDSPPVRLLSPKGAADPYFAGFGWTGTGVTLPDANTVWTATGGTLTPTTPVTLSWNNGHGQVFAIKLSIDDGYLFGVAQSVTNAAPTPIAVHPYAAVSRSGLPKDISTWQSHLGPVGVFDRAANYDVNYTNLDGQEPGFFARLFGTTVKAGVNSFQTTGGWIGFSDKYWLAAVIPDPKAQVDASFHADSGQYQADYTPTAPTLIAPGQSSTFSSYLFAGGKDASLLDSYDSKYGIDKLDHSIDWGWFIWFEKPIFFLLDWLFRQVGNFGVAILLLTVIVRALMFPIAQRQFRSAAQMKMVQPKMKALQEKHKEDKVTLQQEIMKLYKEEKVNPVAGCLPVFLQIPIFFSLYKVLTLTLEMRHQPFVLWIKDLSAPDPLTPVNLFGYLPFEPTGFLHLSVLAIILGVTMYLQFKLNPQVGIDPAQQQIFSLMPWFMMFIMSPFAAGLQIYYIASNSITILQQKWLYSRMPGMKAAAAK